MLAKDLLRRIRKIEITTRRAVQDTLAGQYHSVFKGRGMAFDEVRAYEPGDEIRSIDWNVSARMNQLFVKRFVEERELTVMVAVDLSASADFGSRVKTKSEVAAEIAALLAFSAISNGDRVGLLLLTDQVEKFVPPRKGRKHALRLVSEVLQFRPRGVATNLAVGLEYLRRVMPRRTVTFLVSDFLDDPGRWERALRVVARNHDLVPIHLADALELGLPGLGITWIEDPETGETFPADLSDRLVRQRFQETIAAELERRAKLFARLRLDAVTVHADDADYVKPLVTFFRARARRKA
jgi:uncharacterized protein (DUF58 family)